MRSINFIALSVYALTETVFLSVTKSDLCVMCIKLRIFIDVLIGGLNVV